jgi:D-alanyl-D-alanine carboxypeptidase/D-alanyl-D-alanine-endopeptidase (penicillin-binding protein 4)
MAKFEELNIQCSMINIQCSMKRVAVSFYFSLLTFNFFGQTINQKLQKAFIVFEKDSQLKHAISSLYVIDANTGQVVFDKNSQIGLAPASTQKIITSVTAFELLGKDYRYKTELGYTGKIENNSLQGSLFLKGYCDPTLGSWRYETTKDSVILYKWLSGIQSLGIKKISGGIIYNIYDFTAQSIPDGWIWQDIGNYYGAYADVLNWKENQYDLILSSGSKVGDKVKIKDGEGMQNELRSAERGSGDNAYVYFPKGANGVLVSGTIPINEKEFKISASDPFAVENLTLSLGHFLNLKGINGKGLGGLSRSQIDFAWDSNQKFQSIITHYSPTLDSIIYWFNKKSINLYGEALIKTFAYEKKGFGSTDSGVVVVKNFWKEKGLDEDEMGIVDGSGLSPLNRVTTHSQVEILKYAKTKDWFPYFYNSLPEYNKMSMKSGTIRGVKGFCGYHKAKNGKEYIFSFLVNNYNGSASALVNKMYKVLDILK